MPNYCRVCGDEVASEKINQLMLQRKERSMLAPYLPVSLSAMESPNHWKSTVNQMTKPSKREYLPQSASLTH